MATLDLAVIALYFGLTLGVGLWVSRRQQTAGDYFLGARDLPAWAILLSIVATETTAAGYVQVLACGAAPGASSALRTGCSQPGRPLRAPPPRSP